MIVPSADPALSQISVALDPLAGRNDVIVELEAGSAFPVVALALPGVPLVR